MLVGPRVAPPRHVECEDIEGGAHLVLACVADAVPYPRQLFRGVDIQHVDQREAREPVGVLDSAEGIRVRVAARYRGHSLTAEGHAQAITGGAALEVGGGRQWGLPIVDVDGYLRDSSRVVRDEATAPACDPIDVVQESRLSNHSGIEMAVEALPDQVRPDRVRNDGAVRQHCEHSKTCGADSRKPPCSDTIQGLLPPNASSAQLRAHGLAGAGHEADGVLDGADFSKLGITSGEGLQRVNIHIVRRAKLTMREDERRWTDAWLGKRHHRNRTLRSGEIAVVHHAIADCREANPNQLTKIACHF
mmetsp:Transcript_133597/g.427031  ORF Transcript_133597/g.427031 Transcript_133597/m.427031 type:complete len:304 (-) Transcript_133597:21-932(-)